MTGCFKIHLFVCTFRIPVFMQAVRLFKQTHSTPVPFTLCFTFVLLQLHAVTWITFHLSLQCSRYPPSPFPPNKHFWLLFDTWYFCTTVFKSIWCFDFWHPGSYGCIQTANPIAFMVCVYVHVHESYLCHSHFNKSKHRLNPSLEFPLLLEGCWCFHGIKTSFDKSLTQPNQTKKITF